jgi:hypothetical protein
VEGIVEAYFKAVGTIPTGDWQVWWKPRKPPAQKTSWQACLIWTPYKIGDSLDQYNPNWNLPENPSIPKSTELFADEWRSMPSPFQIMHSCRCTVVTCQPSRLAVTHHIQNTARHVSLCDARLRQSRVSGSARQCHLLSIAHTYNLLSWGAVISCIWWITTTCSWVLLRQWLHKYTQKFMTPVIIYIACNKNNRLRSLTGFCYLHKWGSILRYKVRLGHDADHLPPSSAEVKNE